MERTCRGREKNKASIRFEPMTFEVGEKTKTKKQTNKQTKQNENEKKQKETKRKKCLVGFCAKENKTTLCRLAWEVYYIKT